MFSPPKVATAAFTRLVYATSGGRHGNHARDRVATSEDVAQEVFVAAFFGMKKFRNPQSFLTMSVGARQRVSRRWNQGAKLATHSTGVMIRQREVRREDFFTRYEMRPSRSTRKRESEKGRRP